MANKNNISLKKLCCSFLLVVGLFPNITLAQTRTVLYSDLSNRADVNDRIANEGDIIGYVYVPHNIAPHYHKEKYRFNKYTPLYPTSPAVATANRRSYIAHSDSSENNYSAQSSPHSFYNRFSPNNSFYGNDWQGSYLGILGDMTQNSSNIWNKNFVGNISSSALGVGLFGGLTYQSRFFAYGFEGQGMIPATKSSKNDYNIVRLFSGNIRTRLAVPMGDWMPYGLVGLGVNYVRFSDLSDNNTKMHLKYIYGAGADVKMSDSSFVRLECVVNHIHDKTENLNDTKVVAKGTCYSFRFGVAERF